MITLRKLVFLSLLTLGVAGFFLVGNVKMHEQATEFREEQVLSTSSLAIDVGPGPSIIAWERG